MKKFITLAIAALFMFASCTESKTSTKEKEEMEVMDSTSKKVEDATEKLEEQTEKVEKSLEKLDKEFSDTTK
jgi:hypothetical protein